jgi:hypothetical protein
MPSLVQTALMLLLTQRLYQRRERLSRSPITLPMKLANGDFALQNLLG